MKKLPLGLQSFRKIIEGGLVYIDKTRYIYNLINNASYYFLSRPRRFGKSLLLDTIEETFSGDRELFKGLWIYDSDYSFTRHPVLRLDMSGLATESADILKLSVLSVLRQRITDEGLNIPDDIPTDAFRILIESLYKKYRQSVVILIDEYDKPVLDHLSEPEKADKNRAVLKSIYGVLKSLDPYLHFVFITGVTKFTKTSIFSELNNLLDITLMSNYANICGITLDDLDAYLSDHIQNLNSLPDFGGTINMRDEILAWYNGYSWDGATRLINPYSLFYFFTQMRFSGFWFASGTPTFLIKLLKGRPESLLALKNFEISERMLDSFDIMRMDIEPLLFQTGYLTIDKKTFRGVQTNYILKIPNREVEEALYLNIIAEFTEKGNSYAENSYMRIYESLSNGDIQDMLLILKSLYASIPYQLHINREAYYHSIFYAVMRVIGVNAEAEVSVSGGRVDAVLEFERYVYIFEFKYKDCGPDIGENGKQAIFDEVLDEGARQIIENSYAKRYAGGSKIVRQAAIAFLGRDDIQIRVI